MMLRERLGPALAREEVLAASKGRSSKERAGAPEDSNQESAVSFFLRTLGSKAAAKAFQGGAKSRGAPHAVLHLARREKQRDVPFKFYKYEATHQGEQHRMTQPMHSKKDYQ